MQAAILAGGRGKRLQPITDYIPKPLIPVANIPILEWQLRYLGAQGITDVVVCTGYKAEMIQNYLVRHQHDTVSVSVENTPMGTGGAIKNAANLITGDEFIVLNGDVITNIAISDLATNSIAAVPLRTTFGILELKGDRVVRFGEKAIIPNKWMNAGIYRFEASVLEQLPVTGDLERTLFPKWAGDSQMGVTRFADARWHSIDSFKDIEECAEMLKYTYGQRSHRGIESSDRHHG